MIRILESQVVDQIAAGEVLERPANLVKEIIENSLDAGANEIQVEFENGGRMVSISDNGSGMNREDLGLCLSRHATSKIEKSSDLYRLQSYGFRGEALASIAAVSDLKVLSRTRASAEGFQIQSHFGTVEAPVGVSAKPGTEVRVRDLFANVPARLEFMKSDSSEHQAIKNMLKAFGLAREDVTFSARLKGDLVAHWPATSDFLSRAKAVLQNEELFHGVLERDGFKVEVAVSSPTSTQAVNRNLWFFVLGRWIQDRSLSAAVMEGYRNLLMHGEYPTAVVRLSVPPESVDVNVHPTKSAVKFRDSQVIFRLVVGAVRSVLEKAPWLAEKPSFAAGPRLTQKEMPAPSLSFHAPEFERVQYSAKSFPLGEVREAVTSYTTSPMPSAKLESFRWADLQVVGQVNLTYIVAQSADSFYLVDQHAAHERVVFERLYQSFRSGKMDVQTLLLPLAIDLTETEAEALLVQRAAFEKMGISLDRLSPESVVVQTHPSLIQENAIVEALKKAAHDLASQGGTSAVDSRVADLFATMACHSVVRAGQALSLEQMQQLLLQMDEFPLSSFCPHGRPVFVRRRFQDIEREFGRIV